MSSKFRTGGEAGSLERCGCGSELLRPVHSLRPFKLFYKEFLAAGQTKGWIEQQRVRSMIHMFSSKMVLVLGLLILGTISAPWAADEGSQQPSASTTDALKGEVKERGGSQAPLQGLQPGAMAPQPSPGPEQIRGNTCIARIQYRITYNLRAYPNL